MVHYGACLYHSSDGNPSRQTSTDRYELLPVPAAPSAQDSDAGFVSYKYAQKLPFLVERSDIGKGPGDGSIIRLTAAHHSNDRKKGSIFL